MKQRHQLFVAMLCVADGLVATLAAFLAWALRRWVFERVQIETLWPLAWEDYFKEPLYLFVVPITLLAMWMFRLYQPRRDQSLWIEQGQILKAGVAAIAAVVVVLWAVGNEAVTVGERRAPVTVLGVPANTGRYQIATLALILPVALGLHRACFRVGLRQLRVRGWNQRHVAIIGVGRVGRIAARTIDRNGWTGLHVSYFISHKDSIGQKEAQAGPRLCADRPVLGGLCDLERLMKEHRVDAVYLALPNTMASLTAGLVERLEKFPVDVRLVPDFHPRYLPQRMAYSELDGMPVLSYRESPLNGVGGLAKRALDIAGSAAGLVLFAPVMAAAAMAVRLSGPGPVIFKQRRVSLAGQTFKIYKFRTMYHVEDEAGRGTAGAGRCGCGESLAGLRAADGVVACPACGAETIALGTTQGWTAENDPRITPVGRWLRRTSLDELPQLLNVLKGQMSLVGPRPERPELIDRFREDWRGYIVRQHVKAGMTGWAQVHGLRGDTSLRKRLQYDLYYIRHWSVGFDLRILWLTLFRGFVHRNAQ